MSKIPLSKLGYGCYALGGAYGGKVDPAQAVKLIRLAYALGIRFFDTADLYGTEEVLGKAVRPFRSQVALATKVGVTPRGQACLQRKHILAACEASLQRLQTDYIDLYQVHYHDPHTPVAEVVDTLEDLKSQGKIRSYGVGHLPLDITRQYLELGQPQTVLAEMNVAVLDRYLELHPLQQKYDFGLIAFSVTGRGLLTGSLPSAPQFENTDIRSLDPLFQREKLASGLRLAEKLTEAGRKIMATPAQVAIAWVLNQPGVVAALTGPTDPNHLRENCAALKLELDSSLQQEITDIIRRETALRQTLIKHEVQAIVHRPLSNYEQATKDILYVLEYCLESGRIPYHTGIELFAELMEIRKSASGLEPLQTLIEKIRASGDGSDWLIN